jgi:hypothetical protein
LSQIPNEYGGVGAAGGETAVQQSPYQAIEATSLLLS